MNFTRVGILAIFCVGIRRSGDLNQARDPLLFHGIDDSDDSVAYLDALGSCSHADEAHYSVCSSDALLYGLGVGQRPLDHFKLWILNLDLLGIASIGYDLVAFDCAVAKEQQIVRGKWTMVIIYFLSKGTHRFSELRRRIPMLTNANLTKELRMLESFGLIDRVVYPVVPPKVEYSLTDLGRVFMPVVNAVNELTDVYEKSVS